MVNDPFPLNNRTIGLQFPTWIICEELIVRGAAAQAGALQLTEE